VTDNRPLRRRPRNLVIDVDAPRLPQILQQLIEQRRRRHVAVLAEIRRLGERPIDGELDDARVRAARGDLARFVERLQAAVVEEALLDDQIERGAAEGPLSRPTGTDRSAFEWWSLPTVLR
jgi:hypothetical protein